MGHSFRLQRLVPLPTKGGRYIIHSLLYQAALVISTHNKTLKEFADQLKKKGNRSKSS